MSGYPGEAAWPAWKTHADAGKTTFSAGIPGGVQAAFLEKGPAEAYAHEMSVPLFQWDGHTGHQVEIDHDEMEAFMQDTWTKEQEYEAG